GAFRSVVTCEPGSSRRCPSVTTTSPGCRPFWTTVSWSTRWAVTTVRCSTVESGLTTKTYWPSCPVCTACEGTTIACGTTASRSETRANCPGHNEWLALANV